MNEGTVEAFLQGLLREIDPAAQIVTATREPAGFYAVQVQTLDQAGKLLYLPGGLLTQAQDGNTTALRAIRLLLSSMVREIHSRQVQDRAKRLRYERGRPPPMPEMPSGRIALLRALNQPGQHPAALLPRELPTAPPRSR